MIGNNGMIKNMQQLRRVINICIKNDWLTTDPFINFSMKIQSNERGYLTKMITKISPDLFGFLQSSCQRHTKSKFLRPFTNI